MMMMMVIVRLVMMTMVMMMMMASICGWVVTISEVEPRWRRLCHSKPASSFHCNALCVVCTLSREGGQGGLTGEPLPPLGRNVSQNKARFGLKVEPHGDDNL